MINELLNICVGYVNFEVFCTCARDLCHLSDYMKHTKIDKIPTIETVFKNDWINTMLRLNMHNKIQNPECYAAKIGSLKILNFFLKNLNKSNKNKIIHIACKHGHTNLVKHIVTTCKVNVTESLLKIAYENKQNETLQYLYPVYQEHLKIYLINV